MRAIKRADLSSLYSDRPEEIARYLKNGTWDHAAPPNYGKVIDITLRVHTKTGKAYIFRRMIHADCCGE